MSESEDIAVQNQEAIAEIAWTLSASRGQFSLVFARCNYAQVRDRVITELREQFSGLLVWDVPVGTDAVLEGLLVDLADLGTVPEGVMVTGLEGVKDLEGVLAKINRGREEWRSACAFPVILWLTDEGLRSLMRFAPDFESWGGTTRFEQSINETLSWIKDLKEYWFTHRSIPTNQMRIWESELENAFQDVFKIKSSENSGIKADILMLQGLMSQCKKDTDRTIIYFQKSLNFIPENTVSLEKVEILKQLTYFRYLKVFRDPDRKTNDWQLFQNILNRYLEFCASFYPNHPEQNIRIVGKPIALLGHWGVVREISQRAIELHQNEPMDLARDYGFLAEAAIANQQWGNAIKLAEKALETLKSIEGEIPGVYEIAVNYSICRPDGSLYRYLLSQGYQGIDDIGNAIANLEMAKDLQKSIKDFDLYQKILNELQCVYKTKKQYLNAFKTKQELFSIKQQLGVSAFSGAGWLQAEQTNDFISEDTQSYQQSRKVAKAIKSSGRSHDLDNLLKRIAGTEHKLTVLHGSSGVGKSSLVTAGLVPALLEKTSELRANKPVLIRQYTNWKESILESLGEVRSELNLVTQILEKLEWNQEHNLRTVLIFDQFEEFFFVLDDRTERQEFYTFLGQAIKLLTVKVILSMREDYLHYLLECRKTPGMERVNDGDVLGRSVLYEIGNFSPSDARSIIDDLTTRSQFTLESALIDRLVTDLAEPLGEVRPIELQIVGAQLQTKGIRTLVGYPVGGKAALVDEYLMDVIKDCGEENEKLASLTAYLLTDERGTRPLKTRSELELELEELLPEVDRSALDLILAVFVGSGLVLRESGGDRFQLVHDYLAGVIRDRQQPRWNKLTAELEEERLQRQRLEQDIYDLRNIQKNEQKIIWTLNQTKKELEEKVVSLRTYEKVWSEEYEKEKIELQKKYIDLRSTAMKSARIIYLTLNNFIPSEKILSSSSLHHSKTIEMELRNIADELNTVCGPSYSVHNTKSRGTVYVKNNTKNNTTFLILTLMVAIITLISPIVHIIDILINILGTSNFFSVCLSLIRYFLILLPPFIVGIAGIYIFNSFGR